MIGVKLVSRDDSRSSRRWFITLVFTLFRSQNRDCLYHRGTASSNRLSSSRLSLSDCRSSPNMTRSMSSGWFTWPSMGSGLKVETDGDSWSSFGSSFSEKQKWLPSLSVPIKGEDGATESPYDTGVVVGLFFSICDRCDHHFSERFWEVLLVPLLIFRPLPDSSSESSFVTWPFFFFLSGRLPDHSSCSSSVSSSSGRRGTTISDGAAISFKTWARR